MLSTLHHTLAHERPFWQFWKKKESPVFRFEILSIGGQIRFFFTTSSSYASFLSSQLYAHYSDIELHECEIPRTRSMPFITREMTLAHHNLETIKSYVNLKDRTEKDSIDPLSSITSALAKVKKNDIGTFIIDFSPIADHTWRTDGKKDILSSSNIPNSMKLHVLHFWGYIGWLFFPISFSLSVIRFLMPRNNEEHSEGKDSHGKKEHIEEKTESFGYSVRIMLGKNSRDTISDDLFLKELSGSMNIFANPSGNSFSMKKSRK